MKVESRVYSEINERNKSCTAYPRFMTGCKELDAIGKFLTSAGGGGRVGGWDGTMTPLGGAVVISSQSFPLASSVVLNNGVE